MMRSYPQRVAVHAEFSALLRDCVPESLRTVLRLREQWPSLVGQALAKHSNPVSWQRGVLKIMVDHPTWLSQFSFLKTDLLHKLSTTSAASGIRDVQFFVGVLAVKEGLDPQQVEDEQYSSSPVGLTAIALDAIERRVEPLRKADPELEKIGRRFLIRRYRRTLAMQTQQLSGSQDASLG